MTTNDCASREGKAQELKHEETGLLPCPFCGNRNVVFQGSTRGLYVDCISCGVDTYLGGTQDPLEAAKLWNKRAALIPTGESSQRVSVSLPNELPNESTISSLARETAEKLAREFHETYERLAPSFGYETRKESAKPWREVPEQNKRLMIAVCGEILSRMSGSGSAEKWVQQSSGLANDIFTEGGTYLGRTVNEFDAKRIRYWHNSSVGVSKQD